MSDQQQQLRHALEELTTACEADFESVDTSMFGDEESVGGGMEGDCAVTFGMIRRARAALSAGAVPSPQDKLWRALLYWERTKFAVDAVRPDFTPDQIRELNAAEGRLLSMIEEVRESPVVPAVSQPEK